MRPLLFALLVTLPLMSCQKVKELVGKAKVASGSSGEMDKALEALVDRAPEGVKFRKDLPFPVNVECRLSSSMKFEGVRVFRKTAFGPESGVSSATSEEIATWTRQGQRLTFAVENATVDLAPEPPKPVIDPKAPVPKTPPVAKPAEPALPQTIREVTESLSGTLELSGGKWSAGADSDFLRSAKLKALAVGFDDEALSLRGLQARKLWFGKTRWKEGSRLSLSGEEMTLVMITPGLKGHLDLVFEAVEAVEGHPCGRFAISGECSGFRNPLGQPDDSKAEMSITGGKIWMSLIHPLVLKQELDTVMTLSDKRNGIDRAQGHVILKQSLTWKPGN